MFFFQLAHNFKQSCDITFRSIGDSHAEIAQVEELKNISVEYKQFFKAFSYSIHGRLMFSLGRDGLDFLSFHNSSNVISIKPWGPERKLELFNLTIDGYATGKKALSTPFNVKDVLYFVFGEIIYCPFAKISKGMDSRLNQDLQKLKTEINAGNFPGSHLLFTNDVYNWNR